jgi:hypothetical protein
MAMDDLSSVLWHERELLETLAALAPQLPDYAV